MVKAFVVLLILLGGCHPHPQDATYGMICRTRDGYRFETGLAEAVENHWICDHVGMGEG